VSELVITAATAISPVGLDAAQTCAAIRAGVNGMREHPYHDLVTRDPDWDPDEELTAALVPSLDAWMDAPERLLELALLAARDLAFGAELRRTDLGTTALLLALPSSRDAVVASWELERWFATELCRRSGLPPFPRVAVDQSGHTGAVNLLAAAREVLAEPGIERALLVAVDSYHHEQRLEALDQRFRLRSQRSPDGFIPGEAAAGLLIERAGGARPALGRIGHVALADEPRPLEGELSSSGRGLSLVIEEVRRDRPARFVLCDLNGESYRAFEWGTVLTRLAHLLGGVDKLIHPAECVGDIGAASGALLVTCALEAWRRGYAPARDALIWTAAEGGQRAGVEIHAPS
jgi:3-oxoacyl-[acyl-carrier-protein] synthase I